MAQGIKAFAAKPDDLSSIPRTHVVKGREPTPTSCSQNLTLNPCHARTHREINTLRNLLRKIINKMCSYTIEYFRYYRVFQYLYCSIDTENPGLDSLGGTGQHIGPLVVIVGIAC